MRLLDTLEFAAPLEQAARLGSYAVSEVTHACTYKLTALTPSGRKVTKNIELTNGETLDVTLNFDE